MDKRIGILVRNSLKKKEIFLNRFFMVQRHLLLFEIEEKLFTHYLRKHKSLKGFYYYYHISGQVVNNNFTIKHDFFLPDMSITDDKGSIRRKKYIFARGYF